jgi:hypothetical protein
MHRHDERHAEDAGMQVPKSSSRVEGNSAHSRMPCQGQNGISERDEFRGKNVVHETSATL